MQKNWDTENYRIYGVSLNGYDCEDITCDVLSNVRGRFFLTGCSQKDRLVKNGGNESVRYIYSLEKNRPLFWRVYINSKLRETSHKNGDGSYCVETVNEKGTTEKKLFFSFDHQWIRAEYNLAGYNGGQILLSSGFKDGSRVFIKKSSSRPQPVTLYKCDYGDDPEILERAFMRNVSVDVSVFSSEGLEYYADQQGVKRFEAIVEDIKKETAAEKSEEYDITPLQAASGFNFKPEYFKNSRGTMDIRNARIYGEPAVAYTADDDDMYEDGAQYSAPPKGFENIPMQGTAMETYRIPVDNMVFSEDSKAGGQEPVSSGFDDGAVTDLSAAENKPLKKHKPKEPLNARRKEKRCGSDIYDSYSRCDAENQIPNRKTVYSDDEYISESFEENSVSVNPWKEKCDMTLNLNNEVYRYYGETNSRNERNGYGRTEQPNGRTAYEGEYFKDHRDGFGVHYYKDDGVSYAGSWKNNRREGMGVGFKPDDGSVLAGKWSDNKPQGVCVKFDKEGNVTYYGKYVNGKREGFSVVFREDGVLEIVKWKNDEKSPLVREIDLSELI